MKRRMTMSGYMIVQLEDRLTPEEALRELLDNADDAGATKIEIKIASGMMSFTDNGAGPIIQTQLQLHPCRFQGTVKLKSEARELVPKRHVLLSGAYGISRQLLEGKINTDTTSWNGMKMDLCHISLTELCAQRASSARDP